MKKKEPVRLQKKDTKSLYNKETKSIAGIPLEFILITIIMICFFLMVLLFMGPCTESGMWYYAR